MIKQIQLPALLIWLTGLSLFCLLTARPVFAETTPVTIVQPVIADLTDQVLTNAKKTKGGVAYNVLEKGKGNKKPRAWDRVKVHYSGWTTDGEMFDSSVLRGSPSTFPVSGVIDGWIEGLQLMQEGGLYRLWIPEALAYRGVPGRPPGMLVFDVELLQVHPAP